jgi:hypothetical protein
MMSTMAVMGASWTVEWMAGAASTASHYSKPLQQAMGPEKAG